VIVTGLTVNVNEIKPAKRSPIPDIFNEFHVGDYIKVQWKESNAGKGMGRESYKTEGVIVQITDNSIYYRCSSGYVCGVSINHILSGVQVKIRQRAATVA